MMTVGYLKDQIQKLLLKKSQRIVHMNFAAVDSKIWLKSNNRQLGQSADSAKAGPNQPEFVKNACGRRLVQQGDKLRFPLLCRTEYSRWDHPAMKSAAWAMTVRNGLRQLHPV